MPLGGLDAETEFLELARRFENGRLVVVGHGNEDRPFERQRRLRRLLGLEIGQAERRRHAQHLAGGTHLRSEDGIHLGEHVERQHDLLHADVRNGLALQLQVARASSRA